MTIDFTGIPNDCFLKIHQKKTPTKQKKTFCLSQILDNMLDGW